MLRTVHRGHSKLSKTKLILTIINNINSGTLKLLLWGHVRKCKRQFNVI